MSTVTLEQIQDAYAKALENEDRAYAALADAEATRDKYPEAHLAAKYAVVDATTALNAAAAALLSAGF